MNCIKRLCAFLLLLALINHSTQAQDYKKRLEMMDVQSYELSLTLNDTNDVIYGKAAIDINFLTSTNSFYLDLISLNEEGKGMRVDGVLENNRPVDFEHVNDTLEIKTKISPDQSRTYIVTYHGIPRDGLIISKNKFGDRTFFGDNWPNRARHWIPSVDHPSDKAFFTFDISLPAHYQVVAGGVLKNGKTLSMDATRYVWKTSVPLPTKVAVIGAARFAIREVGTTHGIPVSSWVYPQNKEPGFKDYAPALEILEYFIDTIGPYPYKKLANVQSKTRFGGMENASNIFYFEESVNGNESIEGLLAHEIAHQWFGNSATETDWPHLWLSEGFATYMTNLYLGDTHGRSSIIDDLNEQRQTVVNFYKSNPSAVVNTDVDNYMLLLNPNSYQKGGWVLHMLRKKLGDGVFRNVIREYYARYKFDNASTTDFKNVAEDVSGQELDTFFDQWAFKAGHPVLDTFWKFSDGRLSIEINQTQDSGLVFEFPIEVKISKTDGSSEIKTLEVTEKEQTFEFEMNAKPVELTFDPNTWLLYEEAQMAD